MLDKYDKTLVLGNEGEGMGDFIQYIPRFLQQPPSGCPLDSKSPVRYKTELGFCWVYSFLRLLSLAGRTPLCCGAAPPSKSGDFVGAVDEFHLTFGVIADTGKVAVVLGNIDGGLHPGG